jgi:hypothetical protein
MRLGAESDRADGIFNDLVDGCRQICEVHFPRDCGYEINTIRTSGPIEGVQLVVERGAFRGLVGVQRYARLAGLALRDRDAGELRVVAASRRRGAAAWVLDPARSRHRLTVVSILVGLMLVLGGIVATGALTGWAHAVLLLPALLALRMYWASRIARGLRAIEGHGPAALGPATASEGIAQADPHGDAPRWSAALVELEGQRQILAQRFALRPFRDIPSGPLPASPANPAVTSRLRSTG